MQSKTLMKLMTECPGLVRKAYLNETQLALFQLVKTLEGNDSGVSARQIANRLGISVHSASTQLYRLFNKGYLSRQKNTHPSGGREFIYQTNQFSNS